MYKINYKVDEQNKTFEVKDSVFHIGLRKGLIEKNGEDYFFIGDYEELIAFTT
jgi:hypothetical protein